MGRVLVMAVVLLFAAAGRSDAEFNQIDLRIFGMDWAICAHAVSVSLKKIPGVESVDVSLADGKATIRLNAGNTVTIDQVRQTVQRNGFNPQDAAVTARGEALVTGGKLQFKVLGPNVVYDIAGSTDPVVQDALRKGAGKSAIVRAVIPPPKDKAQAIQVKTFQLAT